MTRRAAARLGSAAANALAGIGRLIANAWLLATYLPASTVLVIGVVVMLVSGTATESRPTGSGTDLVQIAKEFAGDPPRLSTDRAILTGVSSVRPADASVGTDIPEDAIEIHMRAFTVDGVDISSNGRGVRLDYPTTVSGRETASVTAVVVINSMDLCLSLRELERSAAQTDAATQLEARELVRAVYDRYRNLPLGREGLCVPADELLPTIALLTSRGATLSAVAMNLDVVLYRIDIAPPNAGA